MGKIDKRSISEAIEILDLTYSAGGTIYIFGNGGSASTASHVVCDFNKGISLKLDKKFRMVCLSDSISTMTAISNDISYSEVFSAQLDGRLQKGDAVIAISGSGNSENIIKAAGYAKSKGIPVIGLTGYDGGKLRGMADVKIHFPLDDMQKTEDAHLIILHMLAQYMGRKYGSPLC